MSCFLPVWCKVSTVVNSFCTNYSDVIIHYSTSTFPIMHLFCPPKFCISIVINFSWDGCNTQEKWKTKVMQNLGGQIRCIMWNVEVAYVNFLLVKRLSYRNFLPEFSPPLPRIKRGETDLGAIMLFFKWLTKHATHSAYSTAWNQPCFCDCLFRTATSVKD